MPKTGYFMPRGIADALGGADRGAFSKFPLRFMSPRTCKETETPFMVGVVCLKKVFGNRVKTQR